METYEKDLPNAEYLGTYEDGSDDWHAIRSYGIGGSEIGTILGLNPWESAYTLYHKKMGNITEELDGNWSIRFGKAFEKPILDLYAEEHPEEELFVTGTYAHKVDSWKHANPDALAMVDGEWKIIEVKTARSGMSELPMHYEAQVIWYMHVLGIRKATVVAVAGMTYQEFDVEYNDFIAHTYSARAYKFWTALQKEEAPDWDGAKSTYETVRKLHPEIQDADARIDLQLWIDLKQALAEQSAAEATVNELKSRVLDSMGSARYGWVNDRRVASRQARKNGAPFLVIGEK